MMKRYFAGALFLLVITANSSAEFLIVVANVGQTKVAGMGGGGPEMPGMPIGPGGMGEPNPLDEEAAHTIASIAFEFEPASPVNAQSLKNFKDGAAFLWTKTRYGVTPIICDKGMSTIAEVRAVGFVPILSEDKKTGPKLFPSPGKKLAEEVVRLTAKKDATVEDWLEQAGVALALGAIDKHIEILDKLAKNETTKGHPVVQNFMKVHDRLAKHLLKDPPAEVLQKLQKRKGYKTEYGKHYILFHDLPPTENFEAKGRIDRLETAYKTVYYWFALRGIELKMPEEKILTVLSNSDKDFTDLHLLLGEAPTVVDSFYSRRENLIVFASRRSDRLYEAVEKYATNTYFNDGGFSRLDVLKGKPLVFKSIDVKDHFPKEQQAKTFGLMLRVMEAQGEVASSSHQGSRQLLFGTGLVPRNVHVPEWAQFGFASFFETPLDATFPSAGRPNSQHLAAMRELQKTGDKDRIPLERLEKDLTITTLKAVVTDSYFRQASLASDRKVRFAGLVKARATAWSLMYYLLITERDAVLRYFTELGKLPRDLELDEEQLWNCFARAFDAYDAKSGKVIDSKMNLLAGKWSGELRRQQVDGKELQDLVKGHIEEVRKIANGAVPPATPGGGAPGGPGGGRPGG